MERQYTAKYSLKQVLAAMGLTDFKNAFDGQPRLTISASARREYEAGQKMGAIQKNLAYSADIAFKTLSNAIASDLRQFTSSIDKKALVHVSLAYINVYLSQGDQLQNNTVRIFKFLKAREKRYTTLLSYSGAIDRAVRRDEQNGKYSHNKQKLNLRLNSLKQIRNMGPMEYNRLLDDIIANLEYNPAYASLNDKVNTSGKIYQKRAARHREKWED